MKRFVFLAFFFLCIVSYRGNIVPARAAEQPLSPAETATLNQELLNMKATLLQMQTQLQVQQATAGEPKTQPKTILSAQDSASLKNVFNSLGVVLAELQSSLMANGSVSSPDQKTAISSVLQNISANLSAINQTLAGVYKQNPSVVATANLGAQASIPPETAMPAVPTPIVAETPSQSVSQNTVSISQALENANQGMAQVSLAARWNTWGWPISIGIIVILIVVILIWRAKKTKPAVVRHQNIKKDTVVPLPTVIDSKSKSVAETVFPEARLLQQQKPESKPLVTPLSSTLADTSTQTPMTQKFRDQRRPTGQ